MMIPLYNHISAFFIRSKPSGAGSVGRAGTRSSVDGAKAVRLHALMALFRRHSSLSEIPPIQPFKQDIHRFTPQNKKSGEPIGSPADTHIMGELKWVWQSARASHSACQSTSCRYSLPYAFRFLRLFLFAYFVGMFISQAFRFVNFFFLFRP